MASLGEQVIQGAQQQVQQQSHTVGDAMQAYHVAATAEHARQELDMEKQKQTLAKASWVAQQYDKIGRTAGPAQQLLIDSFGKQMQSIEPGFNPQTMDVLKKDPETLRAITATAARALSRGSIHDPGTADALLAMHNGDLEAFTSTATKMGEEQAKIQAAQLGMSQVRMQMLEETKRQHALSFSERATTDKIIGMSRMNMDSLYRSEHILNDKSLPVTANDLALAYNDYINAVATGGAATEGKISRELPDTAAQQINTLVQRYAGKNLDLRQTAAGKSLIDLLGARITGVKGNINDAIARQAGVYHDMGIKSGNPYVADAAKGILQQYAPDAYATRYGGKKSAVAAAPAPAPAAPPDDWSHVNDDLVDSLFKQHVGPAQQAGTQ